MDQDNVSFEGVTPELRAKLHEWRKRSEATSLVDDENNDCDAPTNRDVDAMDKLLELKEPGSDAEEEGDISASDTEPLEYLMLAVASRLPSGEAAELLDKIRRHEDRRNRTEEKLRARHNRKVKGQRRHNSFNPQDSESTPCKTAIVSNIHCAREVTKCSSSCQTSANDAAPSNLKEAPTMASPMAPVMLADSLTKQADKYENACSTTSTQAPVCSKDIDISTATLSADAILPRQEPKQSKPAPVRMCQIALVVSTVMVSLLTIIVLIRKMNEPTSSQLSCDKPVATIQANLLASLLGADQPQESMASATFGLSTAMGVLQEFGKQSIAMQQSVVESVAKAADAASRAAQSAEKAIELSQSSKVDGLLECRQAKPLSGEASDQGTTKQASAPEASEVYERVRAKAVDLAASQAIQQQLRRAMETAAERLASQSMSLTNGVSAQRRAALREKVEALEEHGYQVLIRPPDDGTEGSDIHLLTNTNLAGQSADQRTAELQALQTKAGIPQP